MTVDDDAPHTSVALAQWLAANPMPAESARTPQELDEQIARERDAWDEWPEPPHRSDAAGRIAQEE